MEGNAYDILKTERLIRFGEEASGKDRKEAILHVVDHLAEIEIRRRDVFDIHALLADGCVFRSKPITRSSPNRSLIPFQADHPFQSMPITDSSSMPITFWLATGTVGGV